ncbi:MAG: hypothetical protein KBF24_03620, partial [Thiobacillaceae bacterium]|nr:hypothetical protein [Thiobacillaceae bacterium]
AYRVELARDVRFTQSAFRREVDTPSLAMAKPEPGEYWLRVVAIGAEGVESPASADLPVTIKQEIPWWLPLCLVPLL